jgi:hypothetical protein
VCTHDSYIFGNLKTTETSETRRSETRPGAKVQPRRAARSFFTRALNFARVPGVNTIVSPPGSAKSMVFDDSVPPMPVTPSRAAERVRCTADPS